MKFSLAHTLLFLMLAQAAGSMPAQSLRERLQQARETSRQPSATPIVLPAGTRVLRDVAYGDDVRQRFDVYLPAGTRAGAPVIVFVHGGGWANGNKDGPGMVENKAAYWLPKGYVLVSANYRMLPDAPPLQQARDVAAALAAVQREAPRWNADPARVLLMGHSAGAHLAALVGASPALWSAAGATRPRAVVSLDSGALDVPDMMARPRLPPLYHRAFGERRGDWIAASPFHQLGGEGVPMLLVCSSRRADACPQAEALARKAATLGVPMQVLREDLSHGQINRSLGQASAYTAAVAGYVAARLE